MYQVKAITDKNYISIVLKGIMEADEAKNAAEEVENALTKVKDGFDIINDISEFKPVTEDAMKYIQQAQKAAEKKGAKRIIRIVGSVVGNLQFKRLQKESNIGYDIIEVRNMDDALKYIEENR